MKKWPKLIVNYSGGVIYRQYKLYPPAVLSLLSPLCRSIEVQLAAIKVLAKMLKNRWWSWIAPFNNEKLLLKNAYCLAFRGSSIASCKIMNEMLMSRRLCLCRSVPYVVRDCECSCIYYPGLCFSQSSIKLNSNNWNKTYLHKVNEWINDLWSAMFQSTTVNWRCLIADALRIQLISPFWREWQDDRRLDLNLQSSDYNAGVLTCF